MATLILNARSGGGRYQPAIRVAAERCGWVIREVGPGADPAGLAASSGPDVLVVAGGDGTVSAVAAVAVERDLPLVGPAVRHPQPFLCGRGTALRRPTDRHGRG